MTVVRTVARSILRRRGLGYMPSHYDPRDLLSAAKQGAGPVPDERMDLDRAITAIRNQGSTSSCTAFGVDVAVQVTCAAHGGPRGRQYSTRSTRAPYWNARALAGLETRDGGAYLRDALKGYAHVGAPSEAVCPLRVLTINQQPGASAYRDGHPWRGLRYSRILTGAEGVARALAAGHGVVIGIAVDEAFLRNDGPDTIGVPTGKSVGGHAMGLSGYRGGGELFRLVNSWGTDWRDHGRAWVTSSFVDAAEIWAVEGWS